MFDTKINAILVISELMASAGKVLRRFRRHGEKFTAGLYSRTLSQTFEGFLFTFHTWI